MAPTPQSISAGSSRARLMFTADDRVGLLEDALSAFRRQNLSLVDIQTKPNPAAAGSYEFYVTFEGGDKKALEKVRAELLVTTATSVHLLGGDTAASETPWFPRRAADLDLFSRQTMEYGAELDADHPGFKDTVYRERRAMLAQIAKDFRQGDRIPRVEYTTEETTAWTAVYERLIKLFPTHACMQHNRVFDLMEKSHVLSPKQIPQLQDISDFLRECTGWTLRPVAGLLSQRDFLNALAFRIFHSTQYIRHHSSPLYTPEPDICHEVLGHIPLLADQEFADFSQELGLASLGASDEDIARLGTLYWFTVEFGLCKENGQPKAYGAGLLSSFGELEYCLTDKPEIRSFDPATTCQQPYPVTRYQPLYYMCESFEDAKRLMIDFARTLPRPFAVRYNAYTQTIEVLDNDEKLALFARRLQSESSLLAEALGKIEKRRRTRAHAKATAPFLAS